MRRVLPLLLLGGCVDLSQPHAWACSAQSDCDEGWFCTAAGWCQPVSKGAGATCATSVDCPPGWYCGVEHACYQRELGHEVPCRRDAGVAPAFSGGDCADHWRCGADAVCHPSTDAGGIACDWPTDTDCTDGWRCGFGDRCVDPAARREVLEVSGFDAGLTRASPPQRDWDTVAFGAAESPRMFAGRHATGAGATMIRRSTGQLAGVTEFEVDPGGRIFSLAATVNWAYFSLDDRLVGFSYGSTGTQRQDFSLTRQADAGELQIDTLQQGGVNEVLAWRHGANGYFVLRQNAIEQDSNGRVFRPTPDDGGLIDLFATSDSCVVASTTTGLYSRDPNGARPWVPIGKRPEGVDLDAGALRSSDMLLAGLTLDGGVTLIDYSDRTGIDACNLNSLSSRFTCAGCPGGLTVVDHRPTRSPLGVVITCRPVSGPSRFFFISKAGPLCDRSELLDGRGYFADTSGFLHESVFGGAPNAWGKASGSGQLYFGSSQLDPQPLYLDGPPALIIAQADGGIDAYDDRSHARVANGALREALAAGDARRARVAIGGHPGWALNAHGQVVDLAGDPDAPLCTVDPAAPALEDPLHATSFSDDAGVGVLVSDRTRMFFGHVGASERLEPRVLPNLASAVQAIEPVPGEPAGIFYVATAQAVVRVDVRAVQWQVSAVPVPPGDLASLWQADGKVRALYRDGRVVSLPSGLTLAGAAGDGRQFLEAVEACGHVLASTSRGLAALGPGGWQPQLADGLTGDAAARLYRAGDAVFEARRDGQLAQSSRLCP